VIIKAGSRQETLQNSSVASFAAQGALNGTEKYSKHKIDELVDSFGGQLTVKVEREITTFTLSFESQFLSEAVELLSQIVLKPSYEATEHEALKVPIHKNASSMDPYTISTESVHYTAYRVRSCLVRITTWANPAPETRTSSTRSPRNRSRNSTTTSMSVRISSSAGQALLTARPSPLRSATTSATSLPRA
jgi:hypothetical protein